MSCACAGGVCASGGGGDCGYGGGCCATASIAANNPDRRVFIKDLLLNQMQQVPPGYWRKLLDLKRLANFKGLIADLIVNRNQQNIRGFRDLVVQAEAENSGDVALRIER